MQLHVKGSDDTSYTNFSGLWTDLPTSALTLTSPARATGYCFAPTATLVCACVSHWQSVLPISPTTQWYGFFPGTFPGTFHWLK